MLIVVNGCSVVGRVTVEGQTSLFSALVWGVQNWGVGWFAGTVWMLAGISMRTTDRLTLGLINFCSQRLSTWVVGSYPQVELLICLKHDSVLTALGFTGLTSILLFISKKQTWPEMWIQCTLTLTTFRSGLYHMKARFTLHFNKILSASCSAQTSMFSKIQRQFLSCSISSCHQ